MLATMTRYYCHDHPDTLTLATTVVEARPGAVALAATPFYPGGGGQLADRGVLRWAGGEAKIVGWNRPAARSGTCSTGSRRSRTRWRQWSIPPFAPR
jgi:hypothetical protein